MDKASIILRLKTLAFDTNEYWVIAGAALVLHGLRKETADIDLACTKELFSCLLLQGYVWEKNELGYRKISLEDDIEIFEEWHVGEIVFIEGIPIASLRGIKEMKIQMGRDKDLQDIRLIDDVQKRITRS